jgi:uncharacterized protein YjiS (DUF1127 family)
MPRYKFDMIETRRHTVHYTVEAANLADARRKAEAGETVDEEEIKDLGVQDRDIFEELGEVTE